MANHDVLRAQKADVNLYRIAYDLVKQRLLWDLRRGSFKNAHKLRSCQDKHVGEKAVIMCNGPSLLKTDFELLDSVFTFGLNKVNLLMETHHVQPSCVVAVNKLVIEQNACFYNETNLPLFLDSSAVKLGVKSRDNVCLLHSTNYRSFARDCAKSIYQGYTVTYIALQLAFHMGFKDVALIGCDHSFSTSGPANKAVNSKHQDPDHFDSRYFSNGQKWQLPDLVESEISYMMARDNFEAFGRRIINATVGGQLEVFERQPLRNFLDIV